LAILGEQNKKIKWIEFFCMFKSTYAF